MVTDGKLNDAIIHHGLDTEDLDIDTDGLDTIILVGGHLVPYLEYHLRRLCQELQINFLIHLLV